MNELPVAHQVLPCPDDTTAQSQVKLTYDERFLRRKVLQSVDGKQFLLDLPKTESLGHGDVIPLSDGTQVQVIAAEEPLFSITSHDLVRLAWHIGNRHTPCQIEGGRLLIQHDHVMQDMVTRLGATVTKVSEPFTPEGGAYGHGRTHGHDHSHSHGPEAHDHAH